LKEIGNSAFGQSGIRAIRIPSNVEKIGKYCFSKCHSLQVVFESDSKLKKIGGFAFHDSGVKKIEIPDGCEILTGQSLLGLVFVTISNGNNFVMLEEDFLFFLGIKEVF
jgi:hypothetical protein